MERKYVKFNVSGWIKKLTEAGVGLIGLAIVAQVIFGANVAFIGW